MPEFNPNIQQPDDQSSRASSLAGSLWSLVSILVSPFYDPNQQQPDDSSSLNTSEWSLTQGNTTRVLNEQSEEQDHLLDPNNSTLRSQSSLDVDKQSNADSHHHHYETERRIRMPNQTRGQRTWTLNRMSMILKVLFSDSPSDKEYCRASVVRNRILPLILLCHTIKYYSLFTVLQLPCTVVVITLLAYHRLAAIW